MHDSFACSFFAAEKKSTSAAEREPVRKRSANAAEKDFSDINNGDIL